MSIVLHATIREWIHLSDRLPTGLPARIPENVRAKLEALLAIRSLNPSYGIAAAAFVQKLCIWGMMSTDVDEDP